MCTCVCVPRILLLRIRLRAAATYENLHVLGCCGHLHSLLVTLLLILDLSIVGFLESSNIAKKVR